MSLFSSLHDSPAPATAVEIAASHIAAANLDWRGHQAVIAAHAIEPLPDGAVVPALTAINTHDRALVVGALGRALEKVGRPRRIGLVVPDVVAKVSLVKFERVPAKMQDLEQLIRWQVRKTAPFPIEEAQVSFVPGLRAADGQEFVVSLARRSVVEEYEGLCAEAGAHAGIVDLATFNVINAVLAGAGALPGDTATAASPGPGDWLLVNVAADYTSIALLRGSSLIFFRNRTSDAEGTLADLVHQTAMYYEDRLQGAGFSRVILAGGGDGDHLRRSIEERVRTRVDLIDPTSAAALTDRIMAAPQLLGTLAPLVGLLLRDHEGTAA
jgi:type IV pilus assembly protein PilM